MFNRILAQYVRLKLRFRRFPGSRNYWESRYQKGGNSGHGSYNQLAGFKSKVMNALVTELGIASVIEFGCGDGNQLRTMHYPRFIGLDVSPTAVQLCIEQFKQDRTKSFFLYAPEEFHDPLGVMQADMSISLDVLYHLIEDHVFARYMQHLFAAAKRYVVIYARDVDDTQLYHVRYRSHSAHIAQHYPEWELLRHIPSPFTFDRDPMNTSNVDFYLYRRRSKMLRPGAGPTHTYR